MCIKCDRLAAANDGAAFGEVARLKRSVERQRERYEKAKEQAESVLHKCLAERMRLELVQLEEALADVLSSPPENVMHKAFVANDPDRFGVRLSSPEMVKFQRKAMQEYAQLLSERYSKK